MPLFTGANYPLYFEWVARGETDNIPVIMLHGLGSSGQDWLLQWTALKPEWPVMTVDLPGHGQSPPLAEPTSVSQLANAVAALLTDQEVSQVHLVGLSLGAVVGLQLAVKQSHWLRSLMLVNGFARLRPSAVGFVSALFRMMFLLMGRMDWVGAWVARSVFPHQDQLALRQHAAERIASIERKTYWYYLRALGAFDVVDSLAGVTVPTLVVAGAKDQILPIKTKQEIAKRVPDAVLHVFENSGHGTPIDSIDPFNELMIEWLESQLR